MEVKEVSITKIDFDRLTPETLFQWLEQWGFWRYVAEEYIIPSKGKDPRLIKPDESPEGLYPAIIIPGYNLHEAVFVIRRDLFYKIKDQFHKSLVKTDENHDIRAEISK